MADSIELMLKFTRQGDGAGSTFAVNLWSAGAHNPPEKAAYTPPLHPLQLSDIQWYHEIFPDWPTRADIRRAGHIGDSLDLWGRQLLDSVSDRLSQLGHDIFESWQAFLNNDQLQRILTIDAADPTLLSLPWELMANDNGTLLEQGVSIRRRPHQYSPITNEIFPLPLRVLVITARPIDSRFVGLRTVADPLLDTFEELGPGIECEFLNPPTIRALSEYLSRKPEQVHAVHFDGHIGYDENRNYSYLIFENDAHYADPVTSVRFGEILYEHRIPLAVIHPWRERPGEDGPTNGIIAVDLMIAGAENVLDVNLNLAPEHTRLFVSSFYGSLVAGYPVGAAVDRGHLNMKSSQVPGTEARATGRLFRETYGAPVIDWFRPAHYQGSSDPAFIPVQDEGDNPTKAMRGSTRIVSTTFTGVAKEISQDPYYHEQGRSREMLQIHRELNSHAVVVLDGYAGSGKSALALNTARWLLRTQKFTGGAIYLSLEAGGALNWICQQIGQALTADFDFNALVESGSDPVAVVGELLQEFRTLVIMDDMDAAIGTNALMPADELVAVLEAVWRWSSQSGKWGSRFLLVTQELAIDESRTRHSKLIGYVTLHGQGPAASLRLARAILDKHQIDRTNIDQKTLADFVDLLGGHTYALHMLLPLLRFNTPSELAARLERISPRFTMGAARQHDIGLTVTLNYFLRRLGDDVLDDLPILAIFRGGVMEAELLGITALDHTTWEIVRDTLERESLITVESIPNVGPPFLRFHSAFETYLASRLSKKIRKKLEDRFWRRYLALGRHLAKQDTTHPQQARDIALRELPNLQRALQIILNLGLEDPAVELAKSIGHFLSAFGRDLERQAVIDSVADMVESDGHKRDPRKLPDWLGAVVSSVVDTATGANDANQLLLDFFLLSDDEPLSTRIAINRILEGERDADELSTGLAEPEADLTRIILDRLSNSAANNAAAVPEMMDREVSASIAPNRAQLDQEDTAIIDETALYLNGTEMVELIPDQPDMTMDDQTAAHILDEWTLVIESAVAASQGDEKSIVALYPLLDQMTREGDWRDLAAVLKKILAGERNRERLLADLDTIDRIIASEVLTALEHSSQTVPDTSV